MGEGLIHFVHNPSHPHQLMCRLVHRDKVDVFLLAIGRQSPQMAWRTRLRGLGAGKAGVAADSMRASMSTTTTRFVVRHANLFYRERVDRQ